MISIVIPALNEEKYLPDCVKSLNNQDWNGEYEIIVVDNGSTDRTAAIAREFGVKVISCPKKGVVYARQAGAEEAKGEIIVQVDADTVYHSNWLGEIDQHFSRHPDSAGLAGRYIYIHPTWWAPVERVYRTILNGVGQLIFRWPPSVSGANFAFRRSAFLLANGYDPASLQPDQWGIARRLSRFGKIYFEKKLVVTTSSRRVAKPVYVLMYESIRNCYRVSFHFCRHCVGWFNKTIFKQGVP
jgi:glycosyltransferase involved in cell wall biosynthesis